ncbi:MAG: hypothetical protein A2998_00025 [Candidatus Staskawiczbacteria bacterium RIFCSPLOWO2_01_FULL_37_25b]|uniref:Uncharacterized protein n=2 Tax=Candidatus Staskawicziibacteriota TaxID=1817916 RepID=A0A1G2HRC3_9BACT|nr:MAG: hypothetical protein A2812_01840 [Candidatus Staskawiczbacteria bacterium RIFCSPHIGHO2_01_FULL_36_16]OGZ73505.1 MAG: hypothetical protein A2998_00025 [Candidatus Staskawiczbacteria bacterium RIFCSPLOWO2_01_FULL_37_25b]
MCENRDGKFVVPKKPSAAMGWWIGWIISAENSFLHINLLWVENPEHACVNIHSTREYTEEFSGIPEAMEYLKSRGVKDFTLSPVEIGY